MKTFNRFMVLFILTFFACSQNSPLGVHSQNNELDAKENTTLAKRDGINKLPAIQAFDLLGKTKHTNTVGYEFTVLSDSLQTVEIIVRALGYFDDSGDGLATAHQVGVWTISGRLLASASVPSGTEASLITPGGLPFGGYCYVRLKDRLILNSNTSYVTA